MLGESYRIIVNTLLLVQSLSFKEQDLSSSKGNMAGNTSIVLV